MSNISFLALESSFEWGPPEGVSLYDTVPDSIKPLVHSHWKNFPPVNPMWNYLLSVILVVLGIINFFGNSIVMYLFATKKTLRSPANMFVVNLAFSDFLMMVSQFPPYIYNCLCGGHWQFGELGCAIYAFTGGLFGDTSLLTLLMIGYDRYCVICKSFDKGHMSVMKALVLIMVAWTYSGLMSVGPFFGWSSFIPEGIMTSCSIDYISRDFQARSLVFFMFSGCYCMPVILIMYFYSQIVVAIRNHEKALRDQAKKMNVDSLRSNDFKKTSQEVRVAKVAVANVFLWLITWTPYAYIVLLGQFGNRESLTPLLTTLPAMMAKTASCYNPIMFAISHPRFRVALQEALPWFCIQEPVDEDSKSVRTETEADK